jgi:acyl carrier protein
MGNVEMQQLNNVIDEQTNKKIIEFLSDQLSIVATSLHLNDRLFHDLGVDGDDAFELLQLYSKEFNIEINHFPFTDYFGNEGIGSPFNYIWRLITSGQARAKKKPLTIYDLINAAVIGKLTDANDRTRV